jgi:ABC-type nitrate/sulfonate/bicarbonate transport system substrate-binding protein
MLTRREFLQYTAAMSLGAGLSGTKWPFGSIAEAAPERAMTTLAIQLEWLKDSEFAGYWIADNRGWYRAAGINPVWISGGPTVNPVTTVAASRAQVAIEGSLASIADAILKGAPLVVIAANYQRTPEGILSLPGNPVRHAKDLEGKKLALPPGAHRELQAILQLNHINPSSIITVPEGSDPTPLVTHQVEAYWAYAFNEPIALKARGIKSVFTSLDRLGLPAYGNMLVTRREYLTTYRSALVRWLRESIRGWMVDQRNARLGASLAVNVYGKSNNLNLAEQVGESRGELPFLTSALTHRKGLFWMSDAKWHSIARTFKPLGFHGLPPVTEMYTLEILKEAYHGLHMID